jgi:hypothetical protein
VLLGAARTPFLDSGSDANRLRHKDRIDDMFRSTIDFQDVEHAEFLASLASRQHLHHSGEPIGYLASKHTVPGREGALGVHVGVRELSNVANNILQSWRRRDAPRAKV